MKKNVIIPIILTSILMSNIDKAIALKYNCSYWENEITTVSKLNGKNLRECSFTREYIKISKQDEINFENKYGFNSNDRVVSPNTTFNCHSMSFNKRKSWINYPHNIIFEFQKAGKITHLSNAKKGDRGVFIDEEINGEIIIGGKKYNATHSFTFMEDYKGEKTRIRSKYGELGEYIHKLSDVRKVYENSSTKLIILESENKANFSYRNIPDSLEDIISKDIKVNSKNNIFNKKISGKSKKEIINSITNEDLIEISLSASKDKNSIKKLLEKNENIKYILNASKTDKNIIKEIEEKMKKEGKTKDFLWNSFLNYLKN